MFQRSAKAAASVGPARSNAVRQAPAAILTPRASYSFANIPLHSRVPAAPSTTAAALPQRLQNGVESLSGVDMRGVKVHRNSAEPARWNAQAFAHGADIHLAPGQEQQLPHEAWHVAQQKQGRTKSAHGQSTGPALNDDPALESEADRMGLKAARTEVPKSRPFAPRLAAHEVQSPTLQRKKVPNPKFGEFETTKFAANPGSGVEIILKFTPDSTKVDASKIALSQAIKTTTTGGDAYALILRGTPRFLIAKGKILR